MPHDSSSQAGADAAGDLEGAFTDLVRRHTAAWLSPDSERFAAALRFATGRYGSGVALAELFADKLGRRPLRVLDLGSGNGGVGLGLAAVARHSVTALDVEPNPVLRALSRRVDPALRYCLGQAQALPFADGSFDVVVCLESFEHFVAPEAVGTEIVRVLAPGGALLLSTPARLRFLFRPDPHCGIRGLLLLPDAWQRFVVNRLLRRRPEYDVWHTYWHLGELLELFPGHDRVEVLWDQPFPTTRWFRDYLWYKYRLFHWHSLLVFKASMGAPPSPPPSWRTWPFPFGQLAAEPTSARATGR